MSGVPIAHFWLEGASSSWWGTSLEEIVPAELIQLCSCSKDLLWREDLLTTWREAHRGVRIAIPCLTKPQTSGIFEGSMAQVLLQLLPCDFCGYKKATRCDRKILTGPELSSSSAPHRLCNLGEAPILARWGLCTSKRSGASVTDVESL